MFLKIVQTGTLSVVLLITSACLQSTCLAQGGGDQVPTTPTTPTTPTQQPNDNAQTSNVQTGDAIVEPQDLDIQVSEDTRNQGFIGPSAPRVLENFVGAASESTGSPLAAEATFGGGVNSSSTVAQFSGSTGGGAQAGFGVAQNGSFVTRRNIRARLAPSFDAPRPSNTQVASRFASHFQRQPDSQDLNGRYSIRIEDRTAYVNGTVNSDADQQRLIRQLRLEPGVYKIVNQLQVISQ